jgi:truncated hemoglobin YjbI
LRLPVTPTLYEWAGGGKAIQELPDRFYGRVRTDEVLAPVEAHLTRRVGSTSG